MAREAIERAAQQSIDDLVIESAGDDGEAQTFSVVITFERAGHKRRDYMGRSRGYRPLAIAGAGRSSSRSL
jgi:hypothetical protein